MTAISTLLPILLLSLQGQGTAADGQLSPVPGRLMVRPSIAAKKKNGDRSSSKNTTRLLGAPHAHKQLAELMADPKYATHIQHISKWISQNQQDVQQAAKDSPLKKLAVEDPVAYNVATFYMLLAKLEQGQDRQLAISLLSMRDEPAFREWISAYAKRFVEELSGDKTPAETVAELQEVTYKDVLKDRLGKDDDDLIESGSELAGVEDEDRQIIRNLAGTITLSDEKEGELTIEPEPAGLRQYYDQKVKDYHKAIEKAVQQASQGGSGTGEVKVDSPEEDRVPKEALPTTHELWQMSAMAKGATELHTVALAREYARFATRVVYERAYTGLRRMADAATARPAKAFEILLAHLRAQRIDLEDLSAAATPAAAQLRRALNTATAHMNTARMSLGADRALKRHVRTATRAPTGFGHLRRAGVDEKGRERTDYKPGEHFRQANDRLVQTPWEKRIAQSTGQITANGDMVSAGGFCTPGSLNRSKTLNPGATEVKILWDSNPFTMSSVMPSATPAAVGEKPNLSSSIAGPVDKTLGGKTV